MGSKTHISWADATNNFWWGCEECSSGCKHCYAKRVVERQFGRSFADLTIRDRGYTDPFGWTARVIFVNSLSDFFMDHPALVEPRRRAWDVMRALDKHRWLLLTKRIAEAADLTRDDMLPEDWGEGWDHIWIGTSVENQAAAKFRMPRLVSLPARHRFVSVGPQLGPVDLSPWLEFVQWVICEGESGEDARPFDVQWARDLRAQCRKHGIAFDYKQRGGSQKFGDIWGGDYLDGEQVHERPDFFPAPPAQLALF